MATATANITWPPVAGSTGYLVEYKESTSSVWIKPTVPPNPTLNLFYNITITRGIKYDLRISSMCATGGSQYRFTTMFADAPIVYIWVENTFTCAQDSVFTEVSRVTNLSSPRWSYYYQPTNRVYIIDQDDTNGVLWWFDPNSWNTSADRHYITGSNTITQCYFGVGDAQYNRLYATGLFTGSSSAGGLLVYDIAGDTLTTIPYGSNGSGTFSRTTIFVEGNNIYCGDRTNGTITIISRNTLVVQSTINLSSIPPGPGGRTITASSLLIAVNGELWVYENSEPGSVNNYVLRYSADLTTFIGFIDTSAYRAPWQSGAYWGNAYYDLAKKRLYLSDFGGSNIIVIDTTTNTISGNIHISNNQGYVSVISNFVTDPITDNLYVSATATNLVGSPDPSQKTRVYRLNRDTLYIEVVYPNLVFSQLTRLGVTNFLYGPVPGRRPWDSPNTGWDTDGIVIKFSR